jgi:hypothetical protein
VFDTNSKDSRIFKGELSRFEKGQCTLHYSFNKDHWNA